jgi:RNA polymerase sigma-70 factor (ECF subfamily)
VQDAFTRLMAAKSGEIEDERGWLIVVTSRLCLDQIKSARSRRERAHDASEIEFVAPPQSGLADPADRVSSPPWPRRPPGAFGMSHCPRGTRPRQ